MTTDNTQELDEITRDLWAKYGRPGTMDEFVPEARQAIQDWHSKQTLELLDRLDARLTEEASGIRQIKTDYAYGFTAANDQTNEAIEAERNKLKEGADETRRN